MKCSTSAMYSLIGAGVVLYFASHGTVRVLCQVLGN